MMSITLNSTQSGGARNMQPAGICTNGRKAALCLVLMSFAAYIAFYSSDIQA